MTHRLFMDFVIGLVFGLIHGLLVTLGASLGVSTAYTPPLWVSGVACVIFVLRHDAPDLSPLDLRVPAYAASAVAAWTVARVVHGAVFF